jgi:hypothetical protein
LDGYLWNWPGFVASLSFRYHSSSCHSLLFYVILLDSVLQSENKF